MNSNKMYLETRHNKKIVNSSSKIIRHIVKNWMMKTKIHRPNNNNLNIINNHLLRKINK